MQLSIAGGATMLVVHLMASPFVGGPERQVLGLARSLPSECRSVFLSFAERGLSRAFLEQAAADGFPAIRLEENAPHFLRAAREVSGWLRRLDADVLCCSGYKPDLIGWLAARRAGVPVVAIAHGWTAATLKVRLYEALDRWVMRRMDAVACVSEAQAARVRRAGVRPEQAPVIRNAIRADAFGRPDPAVRESLLRLFADRPERIVAAAGRLSPEKGFDVFIEAAARLGRRGDDAGFVLFGDGPMRDELTRKIAECGMGRQFVLAGFRPDLERVLPACDLAVSSSHTEGLPVVVLEEMAAGLAVVATAVGGTPEAVEDGVTGLLVPPDDPVALAERIAELLASPERAAEMGRAGRRRVEQRFTFAAQAEQYLGLFRRLAAADGRYAPQQGDGARHRSTSVPCRMTAVGEPGRSPLEQGAGR
jgi:glycosyltransferase involved in cell wall biosynthesis